jgi:hypothetical protein
MHFPTTPKNEFAERLRQKICREVTELMETDAAEATLNALSFQSKLYPERHVWIEVESSAIQIDLEDWQDKHEWDNAVARVSIESPEVSVDLVHIWLACGSLDKYSMLLDKSPAQSSK